MVFSAGGRGFIGTGCSGPRVARSTPLCFSSNSSYLVCPDVGAGETSQTPFSGSLLTSNALVQPPIDSDNWSASAAASSEGSAVTNGGSVEHPFPGRLKLYIWPLGLRGCYPSVQREWGIWSWVLGLLQRTALMRVSGSSLILGAQTGLSVQLIARSVWCWTSCNICWMLDDLQSRLKCLWLPCQLTGTLWIRYQSVRID